MSSNWQCCNASEMRSKELLRQPKRPPNMDSLMCGNKYFLPPYRPDEPNVQCTSTSSRHKTKRRNHRKIKPPTSPKPGNKTPLRAISVGRRKYGRVLSLLEILLRCQLVVTLFLFRSCGWGSPLGYIAFAIGLLGQTHSCQRNQQSNNNTRSSKSTRSAKKSACRHHHHRRFLLPLQ